MAPKRVKQLAQEYGLDSVEMLEKLAELGINAKTHASMVKPSDEEKIRKAFSTDKAESSNNKEAGKKKTLTLAEKQELEEKKKEQAKRRAAVEAEKAERAVERAKREVYSYGGAASQQEDVLPEEDSAPQAKNVTVFEEETSEYADLSEKIDAAKVRQEQERIAARAKARAEANAKAVAKKQAVEEKLRGRVVKKKVTDENQEEKSVPTKKKSAAPKQKIASTSSRANEYNGLLSQIEQEQQRIRDSKEEKKSKSAKQNGPDSKSVVGRESSSSEKQEEMRSKTASKKSKNKRTARAAEPDVPELQASDSAEDRYAQMAVQAEKLQRDKVLAEARAAVAAANANENEGRRKSRKKKREEEKREKLMQHAEERGIDAELLLDDSVVEIPQSVTVAKFAELLNTPPNEVIKRLFMLGQMMTLTQSMTDDMVELIADDLGRKVRIVSPEEEYAVVYHDTEDQLKPRPPVVTVMGHVDHGKTSLLDAIRHTGVVEEEAGGITQHIGASVVDCDGKQITFIDTPGHEAFTAMRARGAQVTDVIVLVVAADDGVMPQTLEAINHAKAANVPIVVAVNKIDKDGANPDRVRQELVEHEVVPEEWGGSNMFVNVSAKQNQGVDDLLETIILQADVLELKANPDATASGFVIEANLDKGRGPVATLLINRGTLRQGDTVVAGSCWGRVRALLDSHGKQIDQAGPADPVEILGLNSVPTAGDEFRVFEDERDARKLAEERVLRSRLAQQESMSHMNLNDLFSRIEEGKQTDLNLIVKADVQGSIEALRDAFEKMDQSEVRINIVHSAVGGITETDVTLAAASDAIIIGFNVRPTGKSRLQAEKEGVDIRLYRVIYEAIEEINQARLGLLSPEIVEEDTGIAEVRDTFKVPKVGTIAGCYVVEGEISRDDKVRVVRDGTVVFEGVISSLKRFKDDAKTVKQGYECGIGIKGFQDIKTGDTIEGFRVKEVERTE